MKSSLLALAVLALAVPASAQQTRPKKPMVNPNLRNQAIFGDQTMPGMTAKESEVARNVLAGMSVSQRKAYSVAVQSVMGAGKVSGEAVMQKAPLRMSTADRTVWNAFVKSLKPAQLGALKKMLQSAALIKPGRTR